MATLLHRIGIDPAAKKFLTPWIDESLPRRLADQVLSGKLEASPRNLVDPALIGSPIANRASGWEAEFRAGRIRAPKDGEGEYYADIYRDGDKAWVELKPSIQTTTDQPITIHLKGRANVTEAMRANMEDLPWVRGICAGLAMLLRGESANSENRLGASSWDSEANLRTALYVLTGGSRRFAPNLESLTHDIPEFDGVLGLIGMMDTASRSDLLWSEELVASGLGFHLRNEFKGYDVFVGCGAEGLSASQLQRGSILANNLSEEDFIRAKLKQLKNVQTRGLGRVCFPSATLDGLSPERLIRIHKQLHGEENDVRKRAGLHALGDDFVPGTGYFEGESGADILRAVMGDFAFLKTSIPHLSAQLRYLDIAKEPGVNGRILTGDDFNTPLVVAISATRLVQHALKTGESPYTVMKNGKLYLDSERLAEELLGNINISPRQHLAAKFYISSYIQEGMARNDREAREHLYNFFEVAIPYMAASCLFFFGPSNPTRSYTGHLEAEARLRGTLTDADKGHVLPNRDYYWKDPISRKLTDGTVLVSMLIAGEATVDDLPKIIHNNRSRLVVT